MFTKPIDDIEEYESSDKEIRLKCLSIAAQTNEGNVLSLAQEMYDFVIGEPIKGPRLV